MAAPGVRAVAERHGRLDILVNNAGIQHRVPLIEWADADWERVIGANLSACFRLAREAARVMLAHGHGRIINTGSVAAILARPTIHAYVAAKAGLHGLTRSMAAELGRRGVTVNAICPGATDTPMLRAVSVEIAQKGMRPETVAEGVLNIIRQGADGPTGKSYLVGPSQSAMSPGGTTGPADVARILQATA